MSRSYAAPHVRRTTYPDTLQRRAAEICVRNCFFEPRRREFHSPGGRKLSLFGCSRRTRAAGAAGPPTLDSPLLHQPRAVWSPFRLRTARYKCATHTRLSCARPRSLLTNINPPESGAREPSGMSISAALERPVVINKPAPRARALIRRRPEKAAKQGARRAEISADEFGQSPLPPR